MTATGFFQFTLYLIILLALMKPLGLYMYRVYEGKGCGLDLVLGTFERFLYRLCGTQPEQEMNWKEYLRALLIFNFLGVVATYAIQRLQAGLFLNPQSFPAVPPDLAFNTAASFVTNTNWQAYSPEATISYFTQAMALCVQNFFSAATGMSLLVAFIRGLTRSEGVHLGNFWVDMVRGTLYILLPLSFIFAMAFVSQGVIQNFKSYQEVELSRPFTYQDSHKTIHVTKQIIPMGPAASQVAIKQLGTNGGGFFNANSAHPFENPNAVTNFLGLLAILLIPVAVCYTYGLMVKDMRHFRTVIIAMLLLFVPLSCMTIITEQKGNPKLIHLNIDQRHERLMSSGGNMEGKELRFGIASSAAWAAATTASSNGSTNASLESFTPLGLLWPLWFMQLGEVVFGGVGNGLVGMLILIIVTVFIAGLMVGRTPEYLGKKIEPYEMKMASLAILIMPVFVLIATAVASVTAAGNGVVGNPGPRGFTEILYTFTSMTNNNGSALGGLNANTPFYNIIGGLMMLIGRFWIMIPTLAIAGSLVRKKIVPQSTGTLPTHIPLFILFLVGVVLIIGALTFFPALALGPIVEYLRFWK